MRWPVHGFIDQPEIYKHWQPEPGASAALAKVRHMKKLPPNVLCKGVIPTHACSFTALGVSVVF
jgi:hypothetical protein